MQAIHEHFCDAVAGAISCTFNLNYVHHQIGPKMLVINDDDYTGFDMPVE